MAHQPDSNVIETVVQLLCESGLSQMAEAVRIMLNEAMKIERSQALGEWEMREVVPHRGSPPFSVDGPIKSSKYGVALFRWRQWR